MSYHSSEESSSYNDVSTSYTNDVSTSYTNDASTSYTNDVSTSYTNDASTSYRNDVVTTSSSSHPSLSTTSNINSDISIPLKFFNEQKSIAQDISHETGTTLTGNSRRRWNKALNVFKVTNHLQKVRFIVDPKLHEDLSECPIELEESMVDESFIHYTDRITDQIVSFCSKERELWKFVDSDVWSGNIHITQGKLQNGLMDYMERLVNEEKAIIFKSVSYTSSNSEMRGFLQRGRERMRDRNPKSKHIKMNCYRITKEYFCSYHSTVDHIPPKSTSPINGDELWRVISSRLSCQSTNSKNTLPDTDLDNECSFNELVELNKDFQDSGNNDLTLVSENRNIGESEFGMKNNSDRRIASKDEVVSVSKNSLAINDLTSSFDDVTSSFDDVVAEGIGNDRKSHSLIMNNISSLSSTDTIITNAADRTTTVSPTNTTDRTATVSHTKTESPDITLILKTWKNGSLKEEDQLYFLPRINENFYSECYEGIGKYQICRESITNNITWKTISEIVISKLI